MVQRKSVTVIRDYDRNAVLDFNNGRESTGFMALTFIEPLYMELENRGNGAQVVRCLNATKICKKKKETIN
ncbi:MAG: hypothetical protein IPG89_07205 [Bacteroidetes bacterium]|nr:hypothetical protein [Bacteroidota bacterium]